MKNNNTSVASSRARRQNLALHLRFRLLTVALSHPPSLQLYARWIQWDQDLSHGLPTVAIFLFLVWHSFPWQYRADSPTRRGLFMVALGLASLAWFLFHSIHISVLAQVNLLLIFLLFLASCYSWATLRP